MEESVSVLVVHGRCSLSRLARAWHAHALSERMGAGKRERVIENVLQLVGCVSKRAV